MNTTPDRHKRPWGEGEGYVSLPLLLLGVFIAMLPMMLFREFTPSNELRYLSIVDESLRDGHWWAFCNQGVPYADKPPLYFWLMMLGKSLAGGHVMWVYCIFSVIPAFVIACVMDRWLSSELRSSFRTAAVLMLFSCGLFAGMVFTLRMDMLMTMFIVLALHRFRSLELSEGKPGMKGRLLFAFWIFMAVFTKGPMGILIPLAATSVWLVLTKRMRLWTRAWGWPTWTLLLLLCAGWFGMVYAEGGAEYLDNLLFHQTMGRAVNSFHHKRPVWYYLVSLTYTLQPWTFVIIGAVVYGVRKWKTGLSETGRYFLTIILTTFVLLSVISSKLQVYMLPAYPFMVYLAVMVCSKHEESKLVAAGVAIPAVIFLLVSLVEPLVTETEWFVSFGIDPDTIPAMRFVWYALISGGFLTLLYLYRNKNLAWALDTLSVTVLMLVFIAGIAVREFKADMGYEELARTAMEAKGEEKGATMMTWKIDRAENMDVYLGEEPFKMQDDKDGGKPELDSHPAVVMTTVKSRDQVPDVVKENRVGRGYVVLVCDTNSNRRK